MQYSFSDFYQIEAGCDEAGRGCLSGPVFAAAVILPKDLIIPGLDDSKKISEKRRYELREIIKHEAISWSVADVSSDEIDKINILNASIKAMHLALEALKLKPELILVDGNRFKPFQSVPFYCIVKGDSKFANIAAASILAKTYRDDFMKSISKDFPEFDWGTNKGYPTRFHMERLKELGPTVWHRKSFVCKSHQTTLPL